MTFYEKEKKRIKKCYQGLLIAGLLFYYYFKLQGEWNLAAINETENAHIRCLNSTFLSNMIILVFYLDLQLFWVKEQGKREFLLKKYQTIPVSRKQFYTVKGKIFARYITIFLVGTILIYYALFPANAVQQASLNPIRNIVEVVLMLISTAAISGIFLWSNLWQERKMRA